MKYLYTQKNGNIVVDMENGTQCSINESEYPDAWKQVQDWIAEGGIVQPEPLPPEPSDAVLEAQAEATRQSFFSDYDLAIKMLSRAERLGDITATAKIIEWDNYAKALQELNNTENWYKDTIWPEQPEEI